MAVPSVHEVENNHQSAVCQPDTQSPSVVTVGSEESQHSLGIQWFSCPVRTYAEAGQVDMPVAVPYHRAESHGVPIRGPQGQVPLKRGNCRARITARGNRSSRRQQAIADSVRVYLY